MSVLANYYTEITLFSSLSWGDRGRFKFEVSAVETSPRYNYYKCAWPLLYTRGPQPVVLYWVGLAPLPSPRSSAKRSLVVIRVMKHPTAGGHALGRAPRRRPHLVPTPTRAPSLGRTATEAPAAPLPGVGAPWASAPPTSPPPRKDRAGPEPRRPRARVTFPITPSRLPACTLEGRPAERRRTQGAVSGPRPCRCRPPPRPQR